MTLMEEIHYLVWRQTDDVLDEQIENIIFSQVWKCVESSLIDYVWNQIRKPVANEINFVWHK